MKIEVQFPQSLKFFEERFDSAKKAWQPIIERVFGQKFDLEASYIQASVQPEQATAKSAPVNSTKVVVEKKIEKIIIKPVNNLDLQDKEKWKLTNMILDVFPGTVNQIENK